MVAMRLRRSASCAMRGVSTSGGGSCWTTGADGRGAGCMTGGVVQPASTANSSGAPSKIVRCKCRNDGVGVDAVERKAVVRCMINLLFLLFAGAAEAASTAFAFLVRVEFVDDVKTNLHDRHHDQLRQPLHRLQGERLLAAVPGRDHQLALIIGVDQAYQIPQYDAVLVTHAAAGQDHGAVARIGHVDGEAGGNQDGGAGLDGDGVVDAGAQVQARAAAGGIGGQQVLHAGVENFKVDGLHVNRLSVEERAAMVPLADLEMSWRARVSLSARGSTVWPFSSNRMTVLSSWPKVCGPMFPTSRGMPFFSRLTAPNSSRFSDSAAKPTQ